MTAPDEFVDWTNVTSRLLLARVPEEQRQEIAGWLALYQRDVRAAALAEYAGKIREDASLCIDGLADECCQAYGVALARWLDQQAAALLREHAAPQPDTTKEQS